METRKPESEPARNARGAHLVHLTPSVLADGALVQSLLDSDRLACSRCGERSAVCTRGVYGDIALCAPCEGDIPMRDLARNFGESQGA